MNKELEELLGKIAKCKDKYDATQARLENIKKEYRRELENIEKELNGYYSEIYSKELIKLSVKDLVDELLELLNVSNTRVNISLRGFFITSLGENEDKKEAYEKIKFAYQKDRIDDMQISIYNSENSELLFNSIFDFNMNANTILADGSRLIDNFTENDVKISKNTLFGEKSGIISIEKEILLRSNLIIHYQDLIDNSDYDDYCYPNVKVLREAILNVISQKNENNVKR